MDTQWPAYEVFLQEKPEAAHIDAGSVHAPDAELALFNARDVFVRRPQCYNLWVVPKESVYHRTRQEIEEQGFGEPQEKSSPDEEFVVFCKKRFAGTLTEFASVQASSPAQAIQQAIEQYTKKQLPFAWCAFPRRLVFSNTPEDIPSYFSPAEDKPFRMSTDFHTVSAMRNIKGGGS